MFEKELNRDGDWVTPLPPLTDKDELKYYDRIIAQEPQEEPRGIKRGMCLTLFLVSKSRQFEDFF